MRKYHSDITPNPRGALWRNFNIEAFEMTSKRQVRDTKRPSHPTHFSRNLPCFCGSGKKFKSCCGKDNDYPHPTKISGLYVDHKLNRLIFVTKDVLINQLKRDCPKIALSFDAVIGEDLEKVSAMLASTITVLSPRIVGRDLGDKARGATCARILNTAMTTFIACLHLARGGFRLQYMALSRNVLETICTVLHLMVDPNAVNEFHAGRLKSTKSITFANRVMPGFGKLYGSLSDQFVHVGTMHSDLNPLKHYSNGEEPLAVIRSSAKLLSWLLYIAAELVFVEEVPHTKFWKIIKKRENGDEVVFNPSDTEWAEIREFLGEDTIDEDESQSFNSSNTE
jgi:SEC-C motif